MRGAKATLLGALALTLVLGSATPAGAAEPVGSATLTVSAGTMKTLEQRSIRLSGVGGASGEGRRTRLQVTGGTIGDGVAQLSASGSLKLTVLEGEKPGVVGSERGSGRKRRAVKLTGLRIELGLRRSTLSAKLGKHRRVIFDLEANGPPSIDAAKGAAQLRGARLVWRRAAARALDNRLDAHVPRGALGSFEVSVATVLSGGPGGGIPQSGPISNEPPLLARPAGAVDVTAATLAWHVRDSWIRYVNSQEAPQPLEGAVAEPAIAESSHPCPDRPSVTNPTLVYSYDFPFANGWYDAASGTAALYYGGGVRFSYPAHGIDVAARNPEIEINGGASRAIFRLRGQGETPYPDQRASLLSLVPSTPIQGSPGSFGFAAPIRGALTDDGQTVFAGFYPPPGNGFGCFSISFSTGAG
jgi:hypothetical protein